MTTSNYRDPTTVEEAMREIRHLRKVEMKQAELRAENESLTRCISDFEGTTRENIELRAELAKLKQQEPVAWTFKFNNRHFCTVYTKAEAADIRKHLDANEMETELYLAAGAQPVPEGMVLVPIEPTEAMIDATGVGQSDMRKMIVDDYKAMLEAAKP